MSDANRNSPAPSAPAENAYRAESQSERRLKYGLVVVLTCLVVIALAVAVVYLAEKTPKRLDTTSMGLYSLKPQTVSLIQSNKEKIKIISLYTKAKPAQATATSDAPVPAQTIADQAQIVSDLLDEYKNKGSNISVETIDPVASPTKVDDLIAEVAEKYGGQVDKYKAFADTYKDKYKKIVDLSEAELAKLRPLSAAAGATDQVKEFVDQLTSTLRDLPKQLQLNEAGVKKALKEKPPNYKGVADAVQGSVSLLSQQFAATTEEFKHYKDDTKVPADVRKYMAESLPRYEEIKKAADAVADEIKTLGELKLDTLREALRQKNSILVRGESDWKVLPYERVWRADQRDVRAQAREGVVKPRFAGEQMITTAILALEHPKKLKVAFVRAGGPPVTEEGTPEIPNFQRGSEPGPFSAIARRLEQYNYEVLEKDLSGMYAMMAQQQGQPPPPEPSEEEIKDAVWVVLPGPGTPSAQGPPQTVAPRVLDHLSRGGSALVLAAPRGEDLSLALREWGIELHPEAMAVHELIDPTAAAKSDMIEDAKKVPVIFEIRDWGDSAVTSPIRSLPGILIESTVVKTSKAGAGMKSSPIIPLPGEPAYPRTWGETDLQTARQAPKYDSEKDLTGPLFAGAVAESDKGGRVVVVGAPYLFVSYFVDFPDEDLLNKRRIYARRFPANGELFTNSIFWLSHQDPMIAISPAAMEVNRIGDISPAKQKVWRVGVLLIGLPGLVLVAGALVYLSRRD